jgi:transcriptional regulator with XRE-family HTH domain
MTAGELMRSARLRAELSQEELAKRLHMPRSSIARWEGDVVEPGFSTLRRVLQACGFDLSLGLVPYQPDPDRDERLREIQRLTPQERLRQHGTASLSGASSAKRLPKFDPYAVLYELKRTRVDCVLVGAFARVLQGSEELTRGLDLTPSSRPQNIERLEGALEKLNARRADGKPLVLTAGADAAAEPVIALESDGGEIKLVLEPAGTRGYDDLRRRADREHIGQGLRPRIAAPGDLVRMLEALGREEDAFRVTMMRRIVELDRGLSVER